MSLMWSVWMALSVLLNRVWKCKHQRWSWNLTAEENGWASWHPLRPPHFSSTAEPALPLFPARVYFRAPGRQALIRLLRLFSLKLKIGVLNSQVSTRRENSQHRNSSWCVFHVQDVTSVMKLWDRNHTEIHTQLNLEFFLLCSVRYLSDSDKKRISFY